MFLRPPLTFRDYFPSLEEDKGGVGGQLIWGTAKDDPVLKTVLLNKQISF